MTVIDEYTKAITVNSNVLVTNNEAVVIQPERYNFLGKNMELLTTYPTVTTKLSETTYPTWTASTTAKSIKSSTNAGTISANVVDYEYYVRWLVTFDAAYNENATMVAIPVRECVELWQGVVRRGGTLAKINAGTYDTLGAITLYTAPFTDYYNSSGTHTFAHSASYGFYPSATAIGISSTTSNTPTLTMKRPSFNARCSTTYFDISRYGDIDQTNSLFKVKGEVYRVDIGSSLGSNAHYNLYDLYRDGI